MALNLLSPAEIKAISFLDSTKSSTHLPKLPGGFALRRRDCGTVIGRRVQCSAAQTPPPAWPGRAVAETSRRTWDGPKPISIVGSTGSIGTQTLDIVAENPDKFRIVALAAGSNVTLLVDQVKRFKPQLVAVGNESLVNELKEALADLDEKPEIIPGEQGVVEVARHPDAVTVVTGIVGCAGLKPTVAAIEAGKDIALANKETLIAGGPFVLPLAHKHNVKILPADSEHSAIFQCIQGLPEGALRRIILTASGGSFRDWPVEKLKDVKVADALKHPNWNMGKKITVDSATLFNKGLEVIEAHYLFGAEYDDIEIVIHPQSIIHSMIETQDSSVLAQLGWPDMRLPILYTMSWPDRIYCSEVTWPRLDLCKLGSLTFKAPDNVKYPSMDLAYAAGRAPSSNPRAMGPGVPATSPPTSRDAATTTPTTLLGKYQLGRLLGRGSFAKVYKAQSLIDNTAVAIKIIDKSQADAAMEPRILREISAMRRLQQHPNVLKIHEVLATKSKIYLVVELATGGELFAKISRHGKFPESLARRYFQQLVSALHFCHQNGVAHRDVKPQNLLLDKNGNLKVSDFGLSALPDQLKNGLLHTACGTPAYTAPEVVYRRGYDGSKADAWSCGVILFVLLAGRLPFDDSNLIAMYKKVQRREYEIPAWISKPAGRIIYQLLDPNPNTRLGIEALMEKPWFKRSIHIGLFEEPAAEVKKYDVVPCGMNAFDIISMSSGLDLSGLFEAGTRRERRFTAESAAETVVEKVREVGDKLGYRVERGKNGVSVGVGRGAMMRVVMAVEVMEIAPSLVAGEVKMVEGGGVESEREVGLWEELRAGLENLVVSWHSAAV